MTARIIGKVDKRGYHVAYRQGEVNRCPGCSGLHWHVGRVSAECARCFTAIPLTGVAA